MPFSKQPALCRMMRRLKRDSWPLVGALHYKKGSVMTIDLRVGLVQPRELLGRAGTKDTSLRTRSGVDQAEVNVFVPRRDLNRCWSTAGKRFQALENNCESNSGTFSFSRPIYQHQMAKPAWVECGVLRDYCEFWVACFENR